MRNDLRTQFTSILVDWIYIQKAIKIGQPTTKTEEPKNEEPFQNSVSSK